jgi:alkyldihydroxyacetonephosphate synthase
VSDSSQLVAALTAIVGNDRIVTTFSADATIDWWPLALKRADAAPVAEPPVALVSPRTTTEVAEIMRLCAETYTPVTPFGGGSGVVGSAIPKRGGVLLDLVQLRSVRDIDLKNQLVTADGGVLADRLEQRLRAEGYSLGLNPASLSLSTLGGLVATAATGPGAGRNGGIERRLAGIEAVLADGTLVSTPVMPRWALGPNLSQLFVGSEGTLGVITGVTLRIVRPRQRLYAACMFPTLEHGLNALRAVMRGGLRPASILLFDAAASEQHQKLLDRRRDGCLLLLNCEGPVRLAALEEELTLNICRDHQALDLGRKPAERWEAQHTKLPPAHAALRQPGVMIDAIDIQATWDHLGETYAAVRAALAANQAEVAATFSYCTEQGCAITFAIAITAATDDEAIACYQQAWGAAMTAVLEQGAAIAHHQGIGLARAPWFRESLGDAYPLWTRIKEALDPEHLLNPGTLA